MILWNIHNPNHGAACQQPVKLRKKANGVSHSLLQQSDPCIIHGKISTDVKSHLQHTVCLPGSYMGKKPYHNLRLVTDYHEPKAVSSSKKHWVRFVQKRPYHSHTVIHNTCQSILKWKAVLFAWSIKNGYSSPGHSIHVCANLFSPIQFLAN